MERRRTTASPAEVSGPAVRDKVPAPDRDAAVRDERGSGAARGPREKRGVPEGLWLKCGGCGATIYRKEAEELLNVCPQCGFHWYVSAKERIAQLLDAGTFEEWDANLRPTDPLGFRDKKPYAERIGRPQVRVPLLERAGVEELRDRKSVV